MVRRCRPLLGTFAEIAVPLGFEALFEPAFSAIAHVHARMSFHSETSDLAALRRAPPGQPVVVDPDTIAVLTTAQDLHRRSNGLFDISVGADIVASGFLPQPEGLEPSTMTGTAGDIVILDAVSVTCRAPLLIDLGGIAKGYAVDRAIDVLQHAGAPRALVNAGGDLRVFGDAAEIIHLREIDGTLAGAIEITNAAVASSGNCNDWRRNGTRVFTPHLGRGRVSVLPRSAVTVVACRCVMADAMTKIALAEPTLAATMLAELGGAVVDRSPHKRAA